MTAFSVLGIDETATDEEIRAAYLKKARTAHPDAGGTKEDFQALQRAYEEAQNGPSSSSDEPGSYSSYSYTAPTADPVVEDIRNPFDRNSIVELVRKYWWALALAILVVFVAPMVFVHSWEIVIVLGTIGLIARKATKRYR